MADKLCYLFGGLVMDYYYSIDAWPERSQDGFITGEDSLVGGCAVNMAATVKNLGGDPHVISGVGDDETGRRLAEYMNANGLASDLLRQVEELSGKCLVFLEPDGERTFLTAKGAEGVFTAEMDAAVRAVVPAAAGVTGYYLLNDDADRIMDCIEYLHSRGTQILFDPSPLVSSVKDELLRRIIKVSSVMTPNTTELVTINKYTDIDTYCGEGKTIVVKSGSSGGIVYTGKPENCGLAEDGNVCGSAECSYEAADGDNRCGLSEKESVTSGTGTAYVRSFEYSAEKCEAVDTTGAGDSFAGALLYAVMNNMKAEEAVKLAARCAGITVQIEGPHGFWKLEEWK